jgi:hypothetical protein
VHQLCVLQGLVKYDNDINEVTILTNRVSPRSPLDPNSEITYTNDLAIASDGKVYFSSCSDIVPMRNNEGFYDTFKAWMLGMAQVGGQVCVGVRGVVGTVQWGMLDDAGVGKGMVGYPSNETHDVVAWHGLLSRATTSVISQLSYHVLLYCFTACRASRRAG